MIAQFLIINCHDLNGILGQADPRIKMGNLFFESSLIINCHDLNGKWI